MIWLYRIFFLPALLLALPRYVWRMVKRGGYGKDFAQRLGFFPVLPPPTEGVRRVWIQAVSVGEILALEPLLAALARRGGVQVVLTTTTSTGYALAREKMAAHCHTVGLFPLDFWWCSLLAWRRIRPDLAILMEGEIWPEHLFQAHRRKVPVLLFNARLSDRSFRRYRKVRWISPLTFRRFAVILAASPLDRQRFLEVSGRSDIELSGNLKCDVVITPATSEELLSLRREMGFPDGAIVLLGSSTWPGEEACLVRIRQSVENAGQACRLLLVPRHAERREEIRRTLEAAGVSHHFRSQSKAVPVPVNVYVADTTGELRRLTAAADLVFVGKSLPPHRDGQTPVEAAALGKPLIFGPGMSNFFHLARALVEVGGARQVADAAELERAVLELAGDRGLRESMGLRARLWQEQSRGALARTLQVLEAYLECRNRPG